MLDTVDDRRNAGNRRRWWKPAALIGAVVAISLCHYLTDPVHAHWHVVYQRLYFLPILLGAVLYGFRGGLGLAAVTSVLYLPHIFLHWGHEPLYRSVQLTEIVLLLAFGALSGLLIDRLRREQDRHRRTAEELADAYAQLRATFERLRLVDRLSALGALSAGLAHEIRNPLGSISGAIEILESSTPAGDSRREFIDILKKEIGRLSSLVNRQLDLVRPSRPDMGPCDPVGVVRSVADLARKQAEQQGVDMEVAAAGGLTAVHADEQQLRQAILNLVINAIQAMPGGGALKLSVESGSGRTRFVVEDNGPGFTGESMERAFEPFYTTKEQGTGLGLSIAFQIADRHGGDLRAENLPGNGARMTLEIPGLPRTGEEAGE